MSNSPFLNELSRYMRTRGYSLRTEKTYLHWVRRFIRFHQYQHPKHMDSVSVTVFLDHLANDRGVSINTQKLALNALAFLYNKFLEKPLGNLGFQPASKPASLRGCFYFRPQRYANIRLRGFSVVTICTRRLRANRWQKQRLYLA